MSKEEDGLLQHDDAVQTEDEDHVWNDARDAKASVATTAINLICNIFGGALLVLPTAMSNMSIIPGSIFVLIMGFGSTCSMAMLVLSARSVSKYTYRELLTTAFNPIAGRGFDVVLMLYTYGVLVEFARILADTMPPAMNDMIGHEGVWSHALFWLAIAFVGFWGLSSLRHLSELKISSYLGVATIFYAVFLVITRYFMGTYREPGQEGLSRPGIPLFHLTADFFKGIPVLSVSYSCHYNIAPFYREMKNRSAKKYLHAVLGSIPVISVFYIWVGVNGLQMFGPECLVSTTGDIMKAFPSSDLPAAIGRVGLFLHFSSVFPIVAMATRRCLNAFLFNNTNQSTKVYVVEAFFLVLTSCVLAYLVKGIAEVLDIIGAAFGLSIVYIIPSLVFIRLSDRILEAETSRHEAVKTHAEDTVADLPEAEKTTLGDTVPLWMVKMLKGIGYVMVVFGIVFSVVSLIITIKTDFFGAKATNGQVMCYPVNGTWMPEPMATPSP